MIENMSLSMNVNVMKSRPTVLFSLLTLLFTTICSVNFRFWSNITQMSFSAVSFGLALLHYLFALCTLSLYHGFQYVGVNIFESGN